MYRLIIRFATTFAFLIGIAHAATEVVARFPYSVTKMVYDSARERVYLTSATANSLVVIDAKTVTHVATVFTGSSPGGLSINPQGTHLYVALSGVTLNSVVAVDLETLALDSSRTINTGTALQSVVCGPGDVLYTLSGSQIRQYSTSTKQLVKTLTGAFIYSGDIALAPDYSALYYSQFGLSPSKLYKFDLRSEIYTVSSINVGSSGQSLQISHDGRYIVSPNGTPYYIDLYSTEFFPGIYGQFATGTYPRLAAFSWDDAQIFTYNGSNFVEIYSTSAFLPLGSITLSGGVNSAYPPVAMLTDRSATLVFIGGANQLLVTGNPLKPEKLQMKEFSIDPSNGIFGMAFDSARGRGYKVQMSIDLVTWTDAGDVIRGNGQLQTLQRNFTAGKPQVFFRLIKVDVP